MAGQFTAASSQCLSNSTPAILDYPFTAAAWVNLTAVSTVGRAIFSLSDTATADNYLYVGMGTTELLKVTANAAATDVNTQVSTALVAGQWAFVIGRFISSADRRVTQLHSSGMIESNATSTVRAPAGMDRLTIGALETSAGVTLPWDGLVGEVWYTNTDVQPSGGVLDSSLLMRLALGGPFSVPHIAKDIIEYRSFRKSAASDRDEIGEVFHGATRQVWTNTNSVTIGRHPSLPYWYEKPGQRRELLTI